MNTKLPQCKDRIYKPPSNGYGGAIRNVTIPCCSITTIHPGNMNCKHILARGKCPHNYKYPFKPPYCDISNIQIDSKTKKMIKENDKLSNENDEMLDYLNEIDPLNF